MSDKIIPACLIGYVVIVVVFFGPAQVETERADEASYQRCVAERGAMNCTSWGSGAGIFKAVLWPFWLSYKAAEALQ